MAYGAILYLVSAKIKVQVKSFLKNTVFQKKRKIIINYKKSKLLYTKARNNNNPSKIYSLKKLHRKIKPLKKNAI